MDRARHDASGRLPTSVVVAPNPDLPHANSPPNPTAFADDSYVEEAQNGDPSGVERSIDSSDETPSSSERSVDADSSDSSSDGSIQAVLNQADRAMSSKAVEKYPSREFL